MSTETQRTAKNGRSERDDEVTFEILEHIGSLSTSNSGWRREVNIVAWNGRQARLDIRDWNPEHTKMSRGVGLNGTETENLLALLRDFNPLQTGI